MAFLLLYTVEWNCSMCYSTAFTVFTEVAHRISAIAEELKNIPSAANILVCSHNQTLKILYATLKGIPITNEYWKAINFRNGALVNVEEIKNFESV